MLLKLQERTRRLNTVVAIIGVAALSGCGSSDAPPPPPPTTKQLAQKFLDDYSASLATKIPDTSAERYALFDKCYLGDGLTRDLLVAEFDSDVAQAKHERAFDIGSKRTNLEILAERTITNPDNSTRKEVDIKLDIEYADGTIRKGSTNTLISGSSAGTPGCATSQTGSELRWFGNRRIVLASVQARNYRYERFSIATGDPLASNALRYRKEIRFDVFDRLNQVTYVIVSGPGPTRTVNGAPVDFSLKLLSTRLLRDAPELLGKNNNYLNWTVDDSFRMCRTANDSEPPVASVADCAGFGGAGNSWGWTTSTPDANADAGFASQGWLKGGVYTFKVYADDGWKTVNGHEGKTPIATYTETLEDLPYTFVEMAGTDPDNDKFARIETAKVGTVDIDQVDIAQALGAGTALTADITWTAPPALSDNRPFASSVVWWFTHGSSATNVGGAFWPMYRYIDYYYPNNATSLTGLSIPARPAEISGTRYAELSLNYADRMGRRIVTLYTFE